MDTLCNGTYMLSSAEGMVAAYAAMGIPEKDAEVICNPANKQLFIVTVEDNLVVWREENSALPKYNATYPTRLGEPLIMETPIALSMVITKKDTRTFTCNMTTAGIKHTFEIAFTADGFTTTGNVAGLDYKITTVRQAPEVCGMYLLEDSTSMIDFFVALGEDRAAIEPVLVNATFRYSEHAGKITSEDIFGNGMTILSTFTLGEEFDSSNEFSGAQVSVVTSDYPGSYTMVTKEEKTGRVLTWRWLATPQGLKGSCASGPHTCTYKYKRIPDMQGRWNLVTKQGVEAQMAALCITGAKKESYIPPVSVVKALPGHRWNWRTEPEGTMAPIEFGMNEEYSYMWMGQEYTEVAVYRPDMTGTIMVSRVDGKVMDTILTITKNFLIAEFEFQGLANSKVTAIYTRA